MGERFSRNSDDGIIFRLGIRGEVVCKRRLATEFLVFIEGTRKYSNNQY